MKNLRYSSLLIFSLLIFSFTLQKDENQTIKDIVSAFERNDASFIIGKFNSTVDLVIEDLDDSYSKTQAGVIFKKFIANNKCSKFDLKQQGSANNKSTFIIGNYKTTSSKNYRVYILLKKFNDDFNIYMMEFEEV